MPRNIFLIGPPKSGKTSVIRKVVEDLKAKCFSVGGIYSPEEQMHGTRTGFEVIDVLTGKKALLAGLHNDGPKVSKYHVDIK